MTESSLLSELTVSEFRSLVNELLSPTRPTTGTVRGIQGIADILGVSISTAKRIKASGVLSGAISQCGGVIVTDVCKARELWDKAAHAKH